MTRLIDFYQVYIRTNNNLKIEKDTLNAIGE